jgi:hypothetical protein
MMKKGFLVALSFFLCIGQTESGMSISKYLVGAGICWTLGGYLIYCDMGKNIQIYNEHNVKNLLENNMSCKKLSVGMVLMALPVIFYKRDLWTIITKGKSL